jgi:hypothetical protein
MLPALDRCPDIHRLIETRQFFVLHAARQTGKTTLLNSLVAELERDERYAAIYCSLETAQGFSKASEGIPAIVNALAYRLEWHPLFKNKKFPAIPSDDITTSVQRLLSHLCENADRPVVVLFDEADCLSGQTMITFLRQLRDGYINRGRSPFPSSIALVGMRDIRDYKAKLRPDGDTLGSASPFNVITKSLTMDSFSRSDIVRLYKQHTDETGQHFEEAAIDRAFHWTQGQPWLVNALARECVEELLDRNGAKPVTAALVDQAAENILQRRDTHLDSLLERLKEERARRVVEPVILGREIAVDPLADDFKYCIDLGILKDVKGALQPANPIYAEVILRTLSFQWQYSLQTKIEQTPWVTDGRLDMNGLLKAFQQFWRENSEAYTKGAQYQEASPHIMLMAFLQRVINGGGRIVREYALGRMRLDLLVLYKEGKYPLEVKLKDQVKNVARAREQLVQYLDRTGCNEGWLIVFDRTTKKPWSKKISWKTEKIDGHRLHWVGC